MQPGLNLEVREVMADKRGKGRHTTVRSTLIPLDIGGYVIDTPGIRAFGVWDVDKDELPGFFLEFAGPATDCKFPGCTHTHEEGCRVKDAVDTGDIDARRYQSYLSIRDSL
jgi:ribosome biogenesis GTPase